MRACLQIRITSLWLSAAIGGSALTHQLAAQTVCPTPTEDARWSVDFHLSEPTAELKSILARYHIKAKRASDLAPLTDRDAALCRQIDSVFTPHPVYYWRAGRAVVATNLTDSLMRIESEWYPFFRVFDERGMPIYPTPEPLPKRKAQP